MTRNDGVAQDDRVPQPVPTWRDEAKVAEYVERVDRLAARRAGEVELVDALAARLDAALDLGCGDGRLLQLVLAAHPGAGRGVALDNSPFVLNSLTPSAEQRRFRVMALTITRKRAQPSRSSLHAAGSLPHMLAMKSR